MKNSSREFKFQFNQFIGIIVAIILFGSIPFFEHYYLPTKSKYKSTPSFNLAEVSQKIGLKNKHSEFPVHDGLKHIKPYLSHAAAGASVSVVDINNDGYMDIYVTNSDLNSKNKLFINIKNGTLVEASGYTNIRDINKDHPSLRSMFFDYDNDGDKDLLILTTYCHKVFQNDSGVFKNITEQSGIKECFPAFASNVIDIDNDGYLDIIIAGYFKKIDLLRDLPDTKLMPTSFVNATNGGPVYLYRNNKNGSFSRIEKKAKFNAKGWVIAVGTYDLRNTGRSDVWLATDYGSDQLFFNNGDGTFENQSKLVQQKFSRNGMSAEIADIDDDGRPAVFVTNIYQPDIKPGYNMLWKPQADGRFINISEERNVAHCGWSWGAKFLDLDNDSRLDLIVSNGFISNSKTKNYWYQMSVLDASDSKIIENAKLWPPLGDASISGYQKKCIYKNKNGKFIDVTSATPLESDLMDGRAIVNIDLKNNGRQSFLITNQGEQLHFYENVGEDKNNWIGFSLIGVTSNRDAIGAKIKMFLSGRTITRELQPFNGFSSQSDGRIHIGLGASSNYERIEFLWPSGKKTALRNLEINKYHEIKEP